MLVPFWGMRFILFTWLCFFLLSGYCLKSMYIEEIFAFIKKRIFSLMIPLILFKGLLLVLNLSLIPNIYLLDDRYHFTGTLWFLHGLFFASIISIYMLWVCKRYSLEKTIIPPLVILTLTHLLSIFVTLKVVRYFYFSFYVLLGFYLKTYSNKIQSSVLSQNKIIAIGVSLMIIMSFWKYIPSGISDCGMSTYIIYMIPALSGCFLTLCYSSYLKDSLGGVFWEFIGNRTMPILLFQWTGISFIVYLKEHEFIEVNSTIYVLLEIVSGITIPLVIHAVYLSVKRLLSQFGWYKS